MKSLKSKLVKQNESYENSSNPQRTTENGHKRRREKYMYEFIQVEFYNLRKRADRNNGKGIKQLYHRTKHPS